MGKWEMVRLGDVCEVINGYAFQSSNYVSDGVRVIRITNVQKGKIVDDDPKFYASDNSLKRYLLQANDLLVSLTGNVGRVGLFPNHMLPAYLNQRVACIREKKFKQTNRRYLFYCLHADVFERACIDSSKGLAQKNMSTEWLKDYEIPLPPLPTQQKIADILDRASALIEKRKAQIAKLDLLVKSQFATMFGKGQFPLVRLEDICGFITKGTTPPTSRIGSTMTETSIPYVKVYNLSDNGELLFHEKPQYIDIDTHKSLLARSKVLPNDVLMNIVGLPLGKFALVTDEFAEWNINQAVAIFRSTEKVLPSYLMYAMMQPYVLRPFLDMAVGIRQINLSLKQCRELEIPLPPLDLQRRFADFVRTAGQSKAGMQRGLDKLELLYKSLMQKCFGGEMY